MNYHTHGILHSSGTRRLSNYPTNRPYFSKNDIYRVSGYARSGFVITEETIIENFIGGLTLEFSKPKITITI